jgi:predicted metal-binding protein
MAKHKMVLQNLAKNSMAAYLAAVEIHNKPNIPYRYETVTLLMLNAWELVLKAYIWKYIKPRAIFEDNKRTINVGKACVLVNEHLLRKGDKSFLSVKENIEAINIYRDDVAHSYPVNFEPLIFSLFSCATVNYVDFLKSYFDKDVWEIENLIILPIGFKLPFQPLDFLVERCLSETQSMEVLNFLSHIRTATENLRDEGITDSILLGFDISLQSVKKVKNYDLLVAINTGDENSTSISLEKTYRITNDPGAENIFVDSAIWQEKWKYPYTDMSQWCKINIEGFRQTPNFHNIKRDVEALKDMIYVQYLDPQHKRGTSRKYYCLEAMEEIKRRYLASRS